MPAGQLPGCLATQSSTTTYSHTVPRWCARKVVLAVRSHPRSEQPFATRIDGYNENVGNTDEHGSNQRSSIVATHGVSATTARSPTQPPGQGSRRIDHKPGVGSVGYQRSTLGHMLVRLAGPNSGEPYNRTPTGIDRILPDLSKLWLIHRHRRVICAGAGGSEPSKVNVAVLGYGVSASADDRLCYEAVFAGRPLFRRPLVRAVVAASSTTSPTCASNPSRRHQRVPQAAQLTRTSSWPPTPSSMITSSFSRQTGHNASTLFSLHPCSEARKPQFVSFG
jgi:hypothetical protein